MSVARGIAPSADHPGDPITAACYWFRDRRSSFRCLKRGLRRDARGQVTWPAMGMTEDEAAAEARRRNADLGARGVSNAFYMEVERTPGDWEVEKHVEPERKKGFFGKVFDAFTSSPGP
jgi:hypothetical protein